YVSQYYSQLNFPFRRYQRGKVYRGERNQKGRFREFYQCDIDIIGNGSLSIINDAEIPALIYSTFKELGFDAFTIQINNRKILKGFFDSLEIDDSTQILRTIDKLEKVGQAGVEKELAELGLNPEKIEKINAFISVKGNNAGIISELRKLNVSNEVFIEGVEELDTVIKYIRLFGVPEENCKINLSIVRGLDYYTGTVYETFLDDYPSLGSICSGGRYDNLAEYYTKQKLPGVGMSIGLTRLFYQLREANLIQADETSLTKVLIIPMNEYTEESVEVANKLREAGVFSQVYLESGKVGKKFGYADKLSIPYVIVVGEEEVKTGLYTIRDMTTGEQRSLDLEEAIKCLK
ncbi:MAG: histidine--tRNA ligase, partial [Tissierellaceae bacterium]